MMPGVAHMHVMALRMNEARLERSLEAVGIMLLVIGLERSALQPVCARMLT